MDTKTLLVAIISFILGALLVSIAAVTFEKPQSKNGSPNHTTHSSGISHTSDG